MKIYAHRGAHQAHAEMSLPAYQEAIRQGVDGFECDVRLTSDLELICWHDADTFRITGEKKVIANTTLANLNFATPLRLEELLQLAISAKKDLLIETKHPVVSGGLVEKLTLQLLFSYEKEIAASGIEISLMSFSWRAMQRCKETGINTVFLFKNKFLSSYAMTPTIGPSIELIRKNPEIVLQAHNEGKSVFVWCVNSIADLELVARLGVDFIATDNAVQARKVLG